MIKTSTTISNKLGLHARASAKLTKLAGSFRAGNARPGRRGRGNAAPGSGRCKEAGEELKFITLDAKQQVHFDFEDPFKNRFQNESAVTNTATITTLPLQLVSFSFKRKNNNVLLCDLFLFPYSLLFCFYC